MLTFSAQLKVALKGVDSHHSLLPKEIGQFLKIKFNIVTIRKKPHVSLKMNSAGSGSSEEGFVESNPAMTFHSGIY